MPEWVYKLPVTLAPELIIERHDDPRSCGQRGLPQPIDILGVDVKSDWAPPQCVGRLCIRARKYVGHHNNGVADLYIGVHDFAIGGGLPRKFLSAEGFLVEFYGLSDPVNRQVGRHAPEARRDGTLLGR